MSGYTHDFGRRREPHTVLPEGFYTPTGKEPT